MENNYTAKDKERMRYYLKEMEDMFKKSPKSLTLRNGIHHIRKILQLPNTVNPIEPIEFLNTLVKTQNR